MRLRVSLVMAILGLCACAHIPDQVRIEVDGTSIEVKTKPKLPTPANAAKR
jgi:hypothetical protein